MANYKITIQYDGTTFYGWQSQPSGNTIQDKINLAIRKIINEDVNLIGSGRTDSGVHALGQVANLHLSQKVDLYKFQHSLNSVLPDSIFIRNIVLVSNEFHSRFDAKKRTYIYLISRFKSPFYNNFSYQYPNWNRIDLHRLKQLSKVIKGEHDFTSFCKAKTDTENKICDVFNIAWRQSKDFLIMKIEADRFLHGMVRTIVGTLLNSTINEQNEKYLSNIINLKNRENAFEAAPAKGLFLSKVKY